MSKHVHTFERLPLLAKTCFVAVLILFSGCATAYQHNALTGGYTDARVDANTYRVRFKGNNYTSQEKVEHYLLYRCAEITDQLGYDHFVVVSQDTIDISDLLAQMARVPNYHATVLIKMFHRPDHPAAINAKEIMHQIAARYPEDFRS